MKRFIFVLFSFLLFANISIYAQNSEVGVASYYAKRFHKRRAASGEVYHKDSMVCAHRTLPFGSYIEVWNPKNDKIVKVKVIDRGPHTKGRIVDLSYAAAKELDIISHGLAKVELWEYKPSNYLPLQDLHKIPIPFLEAYVPNISLFSLKSIKFKYPKKKH